MKRFMLTNTLASLLLALFLSLAGGLVLSGCDTGTASPPPGDEETQDPEQPDDPDDPGDPEEPGDPDDPSDPEDPDDPDDPDDDSEAVLQAAGITVPAAKRQLEREASTFGLEAVVLASQQSGSGQLITTGTLTQDQQQNWTYQSTPNDRLVTIFANGNRVEYFISQLNGDFNAPDPATFLLRDHQFAFRVIVTDQADISFNLLRSNGQIRNSLQGTLVSEGLTYSADLTTQGTFSFDVDSGRHDSDQQTQGTINAPDFSLNVNETSTFTLLGRVENSSRVINNSWTISGDQYVLSNGWIRRNFFEGRPDEFDFWRAEGTLTRNGANIGGIGAELVPEEAPTALEIFLDVDGERVVIESHLLQ